MKYGARPGHTDAVYSTNIFGIRVLPLDYLGLSRGSLDWPLTKCLRTSIHVISYCGISLKIMRIRIDQQQYRELKRALQAKMLAISPEFCRRVVSNSSTMRKLL